MLLFKKQWKRKIPIVDSSNDSEEEKSDSEEEKRKMATFVESDSNVIPNREPKYKGIVCYKGSESDIELDIDTGININEKNNIKKSNETFCFVLLLFFALL